MPTLNDREDLQGLSLDELRTLAEQQGLPQARTWPKSHLVHQLGQRGPSWQGWDHASQRRRSIERVRRRLRGLLLRVDRTLGRTLGLTLSRVLDSMRGRRPDHAPAPPPPATAPRATVYRHTATAPTPDQGGLSAAPAGDGAGTGAGVGREIVYSPPGWGSSGSSSAGVVRGPTTTVGSIDHAQLSEEMARAYAASGHRDEAIAIYRLLLQERPDDPELLRHLEELERAHADANGGGDRQRAQRPKLGPSGTGPHTEPFGMLDLEELPERYGVDEVEVMYKDPWWCFVYWEVTDSGLDAARRQLGASAQSARLVLRLFTTVPAQGNPVREVRDVPLAWNHGRRYVEAPRPGALLRVAVGLLSGEGYFAPIAHSSMWRLPPPHPAPSSQTAREWMHVQPLRGRGEVRERITVLALNTAHTERGLAWRVAQGQSNDQRGEPGAAWAGEEATYYQEGRSSAQIGSSPSPGSGPGPAPGGGPLLGGGSGIGRSGGIR
jgi:hypothetical protein